MPWCPVFSSNIVHIATNHKPVHVFIIAIRQLKTGGHENFDADFFVPMGSLGDA